MKNVITCPNSMTSKISEEIESLYQKKQDVIAEYLFEKQWGSTSPSPPPENARENVFSHPLPFFTGNLSANEVRNAISKLKTNKTPGPDGAITELFKWLDDHTLEQLTTA